MKVIKGDLITLAEEGVFDVIIHGCNCQCTMNSGIAKQIRVRHPQAYEADLLTQKGDSSKLGWYTTATVHSLEADFIIVNAYTQNGYGRNTNRRFVNYEAVSNVFNLIASNFQGKKIGYPKIGAGLAGGSWNIISAIINEELAGLDHTLVEYERD